MQTRAPKPRALAGFTLVEILAAVGVLFLLLTLLLTVINSVSSTVRRTSATIDAFSTSRSAFDLMNQKLTLATLNTYWDYDDPAAPTVYRRQSDMHFLVRQNQQSPGLGQEIYFQAPESFAKSSALQSTTGLLNSCGFFVQYGGNESFRPDGLGDSNQRFRYRLMHGIQPTEDMRVYDDRTSANWTDLISNGGDTLVKEKVSPIADNVIALVVWPRRAATDDPEGTELSDDGTYSYNSRLNADDIPQPIWANQLPPTVQVTLISISEASAARIDTKSATQQPDVIKNALDGKFENIAKFQDDLDDVTRDLAEAKVEFHVTTTSVPLRESKWSTATPQ